LNSTFHTAEDSFSGFESSWHTAAGPLLSLGHSCTSRPYQELSGTQCVKSRSCVVHFDGIHLATAFFRSACHWRFGLKNYLLAAKRRCPAPGVPVGGCHERWARPGRSYYPPSACSKMPRSILLVFDLDGVHGPSNRAVANCPSDRPLTIEATLVPTMAAPRPCACSRRRARP
jgi:hypothetical protein